MPFHESVVSIKISVKLRRSVERDWLVRFSINIVRQNDGWDWTQDKGRMTLNAFNFIFSWFWWASLMKFEWQIFWLWIITWPAVVSFISIKHFQQENSCHHNRIASLYGQCTLFESIIAIYIWFCELCVIWILKSNSKHKWCFIKEDKWHWVYTLSLICIVPPIIISDV